MKDNVNNNHKPSLENMWEFIDKLMYPNELVPDRSSLTYEQVFTIYSKMTEIDEMFKEIAQINILKKELNKEKSKETII
ncbi:MAG TPA: hypothetical protein VFX64_03955 [Candidatus Nitrosotalea sp.]|nr:hypothetical protein [Candidatus Nitrosotalea sp.]